MNKFLLICVFSAALVSSANAFKVSSPAADGDKAAVPTKKEAAAVTETTKKDASASSSKVDSLGSAVSEMKVNADAAVAAQTQKAATAAQGMTAKAADVKDNTKTPAILNNMATGLPQNAQNSNKPKDTKSKK